MILYTLLVAYWVSTMRCEVTSPDGYILYREGDYPLIISAPHGGYTRPKSIPNRHNGCKNNNGECVYSHDCGTYTSSCKIASLRESYTKEIAEGLWSAVRDLTGKTPHIIINDLHRNKLDANRELDIATFGQPETVQAFGNYTLFTHQARTLIGLQPGGRGLYVDIHGHTHKEDWVELGYTINRTRLNSGDFTLEDTSIRALGEKTCSAGDMSCRDDLIFGPRSLGGFLQAEGYKVVPSPDYPSPGIGQYYSGGYNTKAFGSRSCGDIDAIQVDMPRSIRFGDKESFVEALARAIVAFMEYNYE